MELPGPKREELRDALAAAYSKDGLRELIRYDLDGLVGQDDFNWDQKESALFFDVVEWAEASGYLQRLIDAAHRRKPGNACLRTMAQRWPTWVSDPAPTCVPDAPGQPIDTDTDAGRERPMPLILGGILLLLIVVGIGFVVYRANAGNPAEEPSLTPAPRTAGNVVLGNLRVTESAIGRTFLAGLLDLDAACQARDSCLKNALSEWLDQKSGDPSAADQVESMLNTVGLVFRFDATFEGLSGTECAMRWSVLDVADGTPSTVGDIYLVDQPGFPYRSFTPEGDLDREQLEFWIPMPPRDGVYALQLEMYEGPMGAGATPEIADSDPFTIEGGKWIMG